MCNSVNPCGCSLDVDIFRIPSFLLWRERDSAFGPTQLPNLESTLQEWRVWRLCTTRGAFGLFQFANLPFVCPLLDGLSCMYGFRWAYVKETPVKGPWSSEEDRHLKRLVEKYGAKKWWVDRGGWDAEGEGPTFSIIDTPKIWASLF